jgi:hypothetical protein
MGFPLAFYPGLISVPTAAMATAVCAVDARAAYVGSEGTLSED